MDRALLENSRFRKADGSGDVGCVEVAFAPDTVGVRDSKTAGGPVLAFSADEWAELLRTVRAGGLDLGARGHSY